MKKWLVWLLVPVSISATLGLQARSQSEASSFLIRKDRPSIYIEFNDRGSPVKASVTRRGGRSRAARAPGPWGKPLFDGEKEERVWLKLYNNTRCRSRGCAVAEPSLLL